LSFSAEGPINPDLIQQIAPGSRLVRAWALSGGISAAMTAFELEQPGGQVRSLILRQPGEETLARNPRAAEDEYRILQLAHSSGLAVPEPVSLVPAMESFSPPGLVIEFISAHPDFSPVDLNQFSFQLAEQLARIHSLNVSSADLSFLPEPAVEGAPAFDPGLYAHAALPADRVCAALRSAWPFSHGNSPVLLHGDYWPGNILWQAGRLAAVVDWEDAAFGDPLADLAISRLDLLWIDGLEAMRSFTRQYLSHLPVDTTDLPGWDLSAALRLARLVGEDLAGWAEFFLPYGRADITARSILTDYDYFVTQALDQLA
jgi:aminoglycoside phosphotransferase (APT) family kinase protein